MHRCAMQFLIVIAFASIVTVARGSPATAQDATELHPIVGTWTWVNGEGEDAIPSISHFHPDGSYLEVMPWGAVLMGVWQSTGENTAVVTQVINYIDDDGKLIQGQGRGSVQIDATGNTMTWQSSFLSRYQDGQADIAADVDDPGQTSLGTRLEPEPMASLDELMAQPIPLAAATPAP